MKNGGRPLREPLPPPGDPATHAIFHMRTPGNVVLLGGWRPTLADLNPTWRNHAIKFGASDQGSTRP